MIRRNDVAFLGGDFNMALFQVPDDLRHFGINATFLGSYAWCKPRGSDAASSTSRASPALAGDKFPGVYFDSLGLFALQPVEDLKRLHNLNSLRSDAPPSRPPARVHQGRRVRRAVLPGQRPQNRGGFQNRHPRQRGCMAARLHTLCKAESPHPRGVGCYEHPPRAWRPHAFIVLRGQTRLQVHRAP